MAIKVIIRDIPTMTDMKTKRTEVRQLTLVCLLISLSDESLLPAKMHCSLTCTDMIKALSLLLDNIFFVMGKLEFLYIVFFY